MRLLRLRENAILHSDFDLKPQGLEPKSFVLALAAGLKSRPDAVSQTRESFLSLFAHKTLRPRSLPLSGAAFIPAPPSTTVTSPGLRLFLLALRGLLPLDLQIVLHAEDPGNAVGADARRVLVCLAEHHAGQFHMAVLH